MYIDLVTINLCPGQGGGGVKPSGTLDISDNGVYDVYSYASASVNVHPSISLSETYISNGSYNITGEFNGGVITVDVPSPQFVTETLNVSANGTYTPGQGVDGYSQVVVDVPQSVTGYTEKDITEGIKVVNLSNSASYVNPYAFTNDTYLQTVNLPNCSKVGAEAFRDCLYLTTVNLPICASLGSSAFQNCDYLTTINIPLVTNIEIYAFQDCAKLSQISLPVCYNINNSAFSKCGSLNSLTLCTDIYWTIPYQPRMLSNTPIMSGTGSIYVRSDTYSLWITSTGWSSLSDRFVSVETSGFALSFSEGTVYGTTKALNNFVSYLGVSKSDITNVSLPECIYLLSSALTYMSLNSVYLPECIEVSYGAFEYTSISSIYLPKCKKVYSGVFSNCRSTKNINLPQCEYVGNDAFSNCFALESIDLPLCSYIMDGAFNNCSALSEVSLPLCEYLGRSVFASCVFSSLNLPVCSYIGNFAFRYMYGSFKTLVLGYSSIVETHTPFFNANPSIYVPASLVDAYKSSPYWSKYSSQIFPIP